MSGAWAGWQWPEGYEPQRIAPCQGCHALLLWARTPRGKYAPLNPDGVNHFATCPQADRFRRAVKPKP